jgi:sugar/nucleoside kinase (ribokinase family)
MQLDLVVLGNLIVDDIVYEDGSRRWNQPGGAALYMGLTAPLWGLRTGLVSVAGEDYPEEMLTALRKRGVEISGVRRIRGRGLRTRLEYANGIRLVKHCQDGATHYQASPTAADLPPAWSPRAMHLAPMPFDLQLDLISQSRHRYGDQLLLSLDPFELLIEEELEKWQRLVEGLDLLFLSEDEVASPARRRQPLSLLSRLCRPRLAAVLYKRGSKGGLAIDVKTATHFEWTARADAVRDTTGAGDAFATGVLAALIERQSLTTALQWGVVSASVVIEGQGVSSLLDATPELMRRRLDAWFGD